MARGMPDRRRVGLPPRPFLYTPDQIAYILNVKISTVLDQYLWYEGRSIGARPRNMMLARNIAPSSEYAPVWRVGEQELIRWMQRKGFKFYEHTGLYSDVDYENSDPEYQYHRKYVKPESDSDDEPIAPGDDEGVGSTDD